MGRHAALQHPDAKVADAAASPPCPGAERHLLLAALLDPFWTPAFSPAPPAPPQAKITMAGRVLIILTIIAVSALLIYQVRHASSALLMLVVRSLP